MQKLSLVLLFTGISSAWWSPPIDFGIDGVDDIKPQVCRVQVLWDLQIAVVWESYVDGNADVFSRFGDGATWSDTFRVTNDISDDIYPRMAYDDVRDCFWCAWQRHSAGSDEIYISQGNENTGWSAPYQLTSDPLVDSLPSVCVVNNNVWVVWQRGEIVNESTSFMNIYASYYDGTAWSAPYPLTADSNLVNRNAKINIRYDHPLVVWEKAGDIYYCEYLNGSWQTPQPITNDVYDDVNPEIASLGYGVWIVWQTNRDGNYEIYTTSCDTFNIHHRKTFSDSADVTPSPIQFIAIGRQDGPPITAFSSNRDGNDNIYTLFCLGYPGDTLVQVDNSDAGDIQPVMTGNILYLWVIWQTDRDGDWDVYGSYIYLDAVQEQVVGVSRSVPHILPNPSRTLCTVHSPVPINCIKIYDALGKLVRTSPVSNGGERIEISSRELNSGVYFVTISNADSEFTTKLIVTR
jgi:hypothetical protein